MLATRLNTIELHLEDAANLCANHVHASTWSHTAGSQQSWLQFWASHEQITTKQQNAKHTLAGFVGSPSIAHIAAC
jgi:hypothetical protein